jgi:uncharacterized protein
MMTILQGRGLASERRWYELRDADVTADLRHMRLLAVPYDTWTDVGWYHERVAFHAPDKSCRESAKGLPLLLFHDNHSLPIGRSVKWTLDDPGALFGDYDLDTDDVSQEAARKARDGFLNGASIGFQPIRSERVFNDDDDWDDRVSRSESEMQVTRLEVRLLEVSLTPTPAFKDAGVQLVRSWEPRADRGDRVGVAPQTRRTIAGLRELLDSKGYVRR